MGKGELLKKQMQYYIYCIGALLFLKFGKMIGNNGIVYLAVGIETIALFMMFIGENLTDVYSKMLRSRRKRGLYHDAIIVKKRLKVLQFFLSTIFMIICLFFADLISTKLFTNDKAALIIRILSPVLLLHAANNYMSGYLKSLGKYISIISINLIRIVMWGILGTVICNNRLDYGQKVANLLKNEDYIGLHGAIGLAIAIVVTELLITILLFVLNFLNDYKYDKSKLDRNIHKTESFKETFSNYTYLNNNHFLIGLFKRILLIISFIVLSKNTNYAGVFYGKFLPLCSIPVLLICARLILLYSRITAVIRNKDGRMLREYIQTGIQYTWIIGLLFVVLSSVLAPQITTAFFTDDIIMKNLLQYGSVLILITTMLIFLFLVNIAHSRKLECYLTMLITTVLYYIISHSLYNKLQTPESILYAACISLFIGVLALGVLTIFIYGVQLEYIYVFMLPLICIGVAGVIVLLVAKYMTPHIGNTLACIVGAILGIVLYFAGLSLCRVVSEQEIERLYGNLGRKVLSLIFK